MALSAHTTAAHPGAVAAPSRRLIARPVRATVEYQAPSTRTGANELEAISRMSNVVSCAVVCISSVGCEQPDTPHPSPQMLLA